MSAITGEDTLHNNEAILHVGMTRHFAHIDLFMSGIHEERFYRTLNSNFWHGKALGSFQR
jgi:bisphosphoglycerate-independent phosphoglycerate mutase (AlkP superfamily)